ncbi:HelD family protein [Brevibacillus sp. B_LB10_24]|uniref:HelD family protein n=1 Tax=Brevibacillus sp. B_LB10_24 TaxID=3380645 RepID=UPI0038B9EA8F
MTVRHPAFQDEQMHLDETIAVIDKEIDDLREGLREATDDYVKQVVLAAQSKELRYLEQARLKPYFGRIDFTRDETFERDQVYIGKRGIVKSDSFQSVVVDWRAPIASLYYSGESKQASYRTPQGIVRGEVTLKRNFAIEDGKIKGIYDGALKETINREAGAPDEFLDEGYIDEFLASHLNQTNDNRLKDIVATIQSEQNSIIRAEKNQPVVVQGVAGSGKTTIALHRLSYLIYNYHHVMSSKKFMVFAPNRLFLHYISDVLPELGVEDVQQTTFFDWAVKLLKKDFPKGWRIYDPSRSQLVFFEPGVSPEQAEAARQRMGFKGSLACRQTMETYVKKLVEEEIRFKSLRFAYKKTMQVFEIPGSEIRRLFVEEYRQQPLKERVDTLYKHLKQQMNKQFFAYMREHKIDLDKRALTRFESQLEQIVQGYFEQWPSFAFFPAYIKLMSDPVSLRQSVPVSVSEETVKSVTQTSAEIFAKERLEAEDLAPLLYLKHLFEGLDKLGRFDHAVVDEAQDLSALEIALITLMTKQSSVTVVGDMAQGIHSYRGMQSWTELTDGLFAGQPQEYYTLEQSYRSTVEIMHWANHVLERGQISGITFAKPVLRHGEKPVFLRPHTQSEVFGDVVQQVGQYQSEGYSSIAIVTKTVSEGKKALKALQPHLEGVQLLSYKDAEYPGGVTILPAYLTKGLQFDVVILLDADEAHYGLNEQDAKLMYVVMTRPVHRLLLYAVQSPTPLLAGLV